MLGLLGDKKKIAQIILSEMPKHIEEKEVPQGIEADFSKAHEELAKEMIDGFEQGEPGKVSRALKQFIKLCMKEDEYSVEEGE
jgi:hypothetical protein